MNRYISNVNIICQQEACRNEPIPFLCIFMTFLSLPSQCSNESVFAADFHPTDANVIVTCGKSHHYFWSLEKGSLVKKQGLFEVMCHKPLWSNSVNLFTFLLNQIACSDMVKCAIMYTSS